MNTTNHYESTVIINGALEEKQITDAVDRVTEFITKHQGAITRTEHLGRKRMLYPIQKKNNGYYLQMEYDAPGEIVKDFARFCRIDEDILRELTLVLSPLDLKRREEMVTRLAEAEREAEEAAEKGQQEDDD